MFCGTSWPWFGNVLCRQLLAFVDGVTEKCATMDYDLTQPALSNRASSLFLGHSASVSHQLPNVLHCQLGNVLLFNGDAISYCIINCIVCIPYLSTTVFVCYSVCSHSLCCVYSY